MARKQDKVERQVRDTVSVIIGELIYEMMQRHNWEPARTLKKIQEVTKEKLAASEQGV